MAASDEKTPGEQREDTAASAARAGILSLAAPLVVSFWLRSAFQWVDTAYASVLEGAGDASIAAIGLTMPFEFMMIACWVGTSNGLTSRLAAAMGAHEGERIEQLKRTTWRIVYAVSSLFVLVGVGVWFFAEHVGLDPDVARQFRIYGTVLMCGSAVTSFWTIVPDSVVKAHHDTRSTMWAGIISSLINVALNTLFVFAFHWGIFGIAFSTVLGRLGGLAYAVGRARFHERRRVAARIDLRPGIWDRPARAIGAIAVPAAVSFLLMSVEGLAINGILAHGANPRSALASWAIFDQAVRFLAMPIIATGVALLPLVARLWGAGEVDRIRRELRTGMLAGAAYSLVVVTPLALLLGPWVADRLTDAESTRVYAEVGLRFVPAAVLLMGPLFQVRSAFEGMQRPRPGLVIALIRTLVLVIPLTWLGVHLAGPSGYWQMVGVYSGFVAGVGLASTLMVGWLLRAVRSLRAEPLPA